jgi:hypothetical protein
MNISFRDLYNQDQTDRRRGVYGPHTLMQRDEARIVRLKRLMNERVEAGGQLTGEELLCAAMLYQHSLRIEDTAMAHYLAWQAHALGFEGGDNLPYSLWLAAAARDRCQTRLNLPQDFGTQFDNVDGKPFRLAVNPAITDEEREQWRVQPLSWQPPGNQR